MRSVKTSFGLCTQEKNPIDILIVDDVDIIRLGLRLALDKAPQFRVVGDCSEGETAVSMAGRLQPDIVLMDVGMPKLDGINAVAQIKQQTPKSHVIMFTSHDSDNEILAAFGAGADGYCLKDLSSEDLQLAIWQVFQGQRWIDPRLSRRIIELQDWNCQDSKQHRRRFLELELKILQLMEGGASSQSVARVTGLNVNQVQALVSGIMKKMLSAAQSATPSKRASSGFVSQFINEMSEPKRSNKPESTKPSLSSPPAILRTEGAFAGRYEIDSIIGRGGMGIVYKAKHLFMERTVALKVLYSESASDLRAIAKFKRESQAASALRHHNIVSVYDFGVTESARPYLVMDYVNGPSLDKLFAHEQQLKWYEYLDIFVQVCEGLDVIHTNGLVHCDLKPSNVMLEIENSGKRTVKIVDFGLAQPLSKNKSIQSKITDSFEVTGSPLYMSPEQCTGSTLDARSDIYSFGCIMYEAFTGKPVFNGSSPYKVFSQHLSETPLSFVHASPDRHLPKELENIVFKALDKDSDKRHQTALELKRDLVRLKNKVISLQT